MYNSNTTLPKYKQLLFASAVGLLLRRDSYYLQLHLLVVVALVARLLLHGMQGLPRLPRRRALAGGRDLDDDLLPLWIRKETGKKNKGRQRCPLWCAGARERKRAYCPRPGPKYKYSGCWCRVRARVILHRSSERASEMYALPPPSRTAGC